jgi:hypothetical protein
MKKTTYKFCCDEKKNKQCKVLEDIRADIKTNNEETDTSKKITNAVLLKKKLVEAKVMVRKRAAEERIIKNKIKEAKLEVEAVEACNDESKRLEEEIAALVLGDVAARQSMNTASLFTLAQAKKLGKEKVNADKAKDAQRAIHIAKLVALEEELAKFRKESPVCEAKDDTNNCDFVKIDCLIDADTAKMVNEIVNKHLPTKGKNKKAPSKKAKRSLVAHKQVACIKHCMMTRKRAGAKPAAAKPAAGKPAAAKKSIKKLSSKMSSKKSSSKKSSSKKASTKKASTKKASSKKASSKKASSKKASSKKASKKASSKKASKKSASRKA